MARRTFAEILADTGFDIGKEYESLRKLVYDTNPTGTRQQRKSLHQWISARFDQMDIRGTCLSLDDFDARFGFRFNVVHVKEPATEEELVSFCEYVENLCEAFLRAYKTHTKFQMLFDEADEERACAEVALDQVERICEAMGYTAIEDAGHTVFIQEAFGVREAVELLPAETAVDVWRYRHQSLAGDLAAKREILRELGVQLEPLRQTLKHVNPKLEQDVFFALNNLGIRHSNLDQASSHFKPDIASLGDGDLEELYDATYASCLAVLLLVDEANGVSAIETLRKAKR